MNFYEFTNKVKIISGEDSVLELAEQMTLLGARNILLISDQNIRKLGYVKLVKDIIATNTRLRINAVYVNIKHGASTENIEEAYSLFRDNSCDSIIAIGGDSVLNAAKVLRLMLITKTKSLNNIYGTNSARIEEKVPFGVVATTIGASRGIGKAAFVRDYGVKRRREFITELMQPDFCILDPRFSISLAPDKIALNVVEMLVNCIELYLSKQRNPVSESYALYAVGMLKDSVFQLAESKDITKEMIFTLQEVGTIAGIALSSSAGGMSLALANAISDVASLDRNTALAIIFPAFLRYYENVRKEKYEEILQYGFTRDQFISIAKEDRPNVLVASVTEVIARVLKKYNIPTTLTEAKVKETDFEDIAEIASVDSALFDSAMWFDKVDLIKILQECK